MTREFYQAQSVEKIAMPSGAFIEHSTIGIPSNPGHRTALPWQFTGIAFKNNNSHHWLMWAYCPICRKFWWGYR